MTTESTEGKTDPVKDLTKDGYSITHPTGVKQEDGSYVIYYTLKPKKFDGFGDYAKNHKPVSQAQRDAVERAIEEIEDVANVKFVCVDDNPEAKGKPIYLSVCRGELNKQIDGEDWSGFARQEGDAQFLAVRYTKDGKKIKDEATDRNTDGYNTIIHEILHGLGLSHPGAGRLGGKASGKNPQYNERDTAMSYNNAAGPYNRGLGPDDILALQAIYGESSKYKENSGERTITLYKLTQMSTLHAKNSVQLISHTEGYAEIDLKDRELKGEVLDSHGTRLFFNPRLSRGTALDPDQSLSAAFNVSGTPNAKVYGGKQDDVLKATGGANVLKGREGNDIFVFDLNSGALNTITDFRPKEDILVVPFLGTVGYEKKSSDTELSLNGWEVNNIFTLRPSKATILLKNTTIDEVKDAVILGDYVSVSKQWLAYQKDRLDGGKLNKLRAGNLVGWKMLAEQSLAFLEAPADFNKPIVFEVFPTVPISYENQTSAENRKIIAGLQKRYQALNHLEGTDKDFILMSAKVDYKNLQKAIEEHVKVAAQANERAMANIWGKKHATTNAHLQSQFIRTLNDVAERITEKYLAHESKEPPMATWLQEEATTLKLQASALRSLLDPSTPMVKQEIEVRPAIPIKPESVAEPKPAVKPAQKALPNNQKDQRTAKQLMEGSLLFDRILDVNAIGGRLPVAEVGEGNLSQLAVPKFRPGKPQTPSVDKPRRP